MSAPISAIPAIPLAQIPDVGSAGSSGGGEFKAIFSQAVNGVERLSADADQTVERFLAGEGEVHTVALAAQRASLALETFVQVRNKVVSAYQSVMQMQI